MIRLAALLLLAFADVRARMRKAPGAG